MLRNLAQSWSQTHSLLDERGLFLRAYPLLDRISDETEISGHPELSVLNEVEACYEENKIRRWFLDIRDLLWDRCARRCPNG